MIVEDCDKRRVRIEITKKDITFILYDTDETILIIDRNRPSFEKTFIFSKEQNSYHLFDERQLIGVPGAVVMVGSTGATCRFKLGDKNLIDVLGLVDAGIEPKGGWPSIG